MAGGIFINYRRDDSSGTAGRLYDRLALAFGRRNLFMDVDHIPAGVDFVSYLDAQVSACDVFLAVIGPRWLDARDENGNRRIDDTHDFVAIEIATALARDIRVIPVLVDGAHMPKAADLPDPLKALARRNAVEVRNAQFGRDAEGLVQKVREAFDGKRAAPRHWRTPAMVGAAALLLGGLVVLYQADVMPWRWGADDVRSSTPSKSDSNAAVTVAQQEQARRDAEASRRKAQQEQQVKERQQAEQLSLELRIREEAEARRGADEAKAREDAARTAQEEARRKEQAPAGAAPPAVPGSGQSFRDALTNGQPCPICPEIVVVPSGSFMLGSVAAPIAPAFPWVTIARPFAVAKFATTFDEWDACVADRGCNGYRPQDADWGRGKRPVINVNWSDANAYAAWLSRKTGKKYRLLSEAEREYVARAGTRTKFWWGDWPTRAQGNYGGSPLSEVRSGTHRRTVPVDSYKPNPWGLYNVHGNVWEWTEDCWSSNYGEHPRDGSARTSGDCSQRVVRGGSWYNSGDEISAAYRAGSTAAERDNLTGFRLARDL